MNSQCALGAECEIAQITHLFSLERASSSQNSVSAEQCSCRKYETSLLWIAAFFKASQTSIFDWIETPPCDIRCMKKEKKKFLSRLEGSSNQGAIVLWGGGAWQSLVLFFGSIPPLPPGPCVVGSGGRATYSALRD